MISYFLQAGLKAMWTFYCSRSVVGEQMQIKERLSSDPVRPEGGEVLVGGDPHPAASSLNNLTSFWANRVWED